MEIQTNETYRLIWDYNNRIVNPDYNIPISGTTVFHSSFFQGKDFNTLAEMQKFIIDNNLTFADEVTERIDPFNADWHETIPEIKLRMYVSSIDGNRLAIEQPEFVMYLKQQNINLIVDQDYAVVWAYLEYILDEHRTLLEKVYNAKFQERL